MQQWSASIQLLLEADKMIFVGYSFPPTDFHAKRIFQIAMMRRRFQGKKTKVLYCGGTDKDIGEQLEGIYGKENEIVIKNEFEKLCDSDELKKFLE